MPSAEKAVIKGSIIAETDKAILFDVRNHPDSAFSKNWIPMSQVSYVKRSPVKRAGLDELHVSLWFANKIGITEVIE